MAPDVRTDLIPVACPCRCGETVALDIGRQSDEFAILEACSWVKRAGVEAFRVTKDAAAGMHRTDRA